VDRPSLDIASDAARIGPVGLDGDDREPARADELLGDAGAHPVELGRAVGRFTDQHQPRSGQTAEQHAKIVAVDRLERLGDLPDEVGQGGRAAHGS
jgi:hypothetical protein